MSFFIKTYSAVSFLYLHNGSLFVCAIIYLINASMNIFIHVSFYSLANISVGLITRSKIVGSKDMCILNNDKH